MVSWVPQILVPPLFALAFFRRLPRRWVMSLAPITFLGDIDYAVAGQHRVLTHTLVLPAALLAVVLLMWRAARRAGTAASGAGGFAAYWMAPGLPLALMLSAYFLTAHDIMDIFTGGVTLFWPFSPLNFAFDYELIWHPATHQLEPQVYASLEPEPAPLDPAYPWFTDEHNAMLAMVLCGGLVLLVGWLRRRRAARRT